MNKDYYGILGVSKDASADEIKKSFRKLAVRFHPDHQAGKSDAEKKEAEEKFKEINEAYETLSDPDKKAQYDNPNPFGGGMGGGFGGPNGMRGFRDANGNMHFTWTSDGSDGGGMGGFGGFDPFGAFADMMGGFRRRRNVDPNAPRPGQDILLVLKVGFMEAIEGCKKTVKLNIEDNDGDKRVLKTITLEVKIPKGCPEGQRLRLGGQGNRGYNGGPNGDIYFQIAIGEHETFVRDGYDIGVKVDVPFETFVLGGKIKIPTLDGEIERDIEPNTVPGKILLLRGKGSPIMNSLNSYGDLRVLLSLVMPDKLSDKAREYLEKYRDERIKHS